MAELTITKDRQELERLEGIITRNLQSFYEVGHALMEIRDKKYYRDVLGFVTFEEYCKKRWDFNSSRARQLIAATETYENLKTVTNVTPINEGQARPLARLEPEAQREAWQQAVETAPQGKVTAAHVKKVVKAYQLKGGEGGETEPVHRELPNDSINLSNLKTSWNASNDTDRVRFIKWVREYYSKYIKQGERR